MKLKQHSTTSWLRTLCAIVVIVTLIKVWVGPITTTQEALGQIPDSGKTRLAILKQTQRTNQLLMEIKQILAHDTLKVRWEGADKPGTDN